MTNRGQALPICAKLRRKEQLFPAQGGGGIGRGLDGQVTVTSYITDDGFRLVNPDGPEAADLLEQLVEALMRARVIVNSDAEACCAFHEGTEVSEPEAALTVIDAALAKVEKPHD